MTGWTAIQTSNGGVKMKRLLITALAASLVCGADAETLPQSVLEPVRVLIAEDDGDPSNRALGLFDQNLDAGAIDRELGEHADEHPRSARPHEW